MSDQMGRAPFDYSDEGRAEQPVEESRIDSVLDALMVDRTPENREQMRVYLTAFEVFLERNRRHRAQWRVGGIQGLLVDIRKKVERMWNEFMLSDTPPSDVDSAVDAINYLAFFVQGVREEKQNNRPIGQWIWPHIKGSDER